MLILTKKGLELSTAPNVATGVLAHVLSPAAKDVLSSSSRKSHMECTQSRRRPELAEMSKESVLIVYSILYNK